jgi:hypothetical protein
MATNTQLAFGMTLYIKMEGEDLVRRLILLTLCVRAAMTNGLQNFLLIQLKVLCQHAKIRMLVARVSGMV